MTNMFSVSHRDPDAQSAVRTSVVGTMVKSIHGMTGGSSSYGGCPP